MIPGNVTIISITSNDTAPEVEDYRYKIFSIIYITVRCLQGLVTILVNVLTIVVILKFKKVNISNNDGGFVWPIGNSFMFVDNIIQQCTSQ